MGLGAPCLAGFLVSQGSLPATCWHCSLSSHMVSQLPGGRFPHPWRSAIPALQSTWSPRTPRMAVGASAPEFSVMLGAGPALRQQVAPSQPASPLPCAGASLRWLLRRTRHLQGTCVVPEEGAARPAGPVPI